MTAVPGTRLGPADVAAAADRLAGHALRTPLLTAAALPGILLKAEHLQHGGSFKLRGAANAMLGRGGGGDVVAGSSGNHGIALALLGRRLGRHVTVVMAAGGSEAKAALLRRLGARVVPVDGGVAERDRHAAELAAARGASLIPSSDDEFVVAGQGTVGLEILQDAPDADTVFVPTGGGGLLAGVCLAAGPRDRPGRPVRIIGVEPVSARRYALSLAAGHPVAVPPTGTIADGLRGQRPGAVPLPVVRDRADDLIAVTDDEITHAMALLHAAGIPAEPSGSVALAGALAAAPAGRCVAIVSGGNTRAALSAPGVHETPAGPTRVPRSLPGDAR